MKKLLTIALLLANLCVLRAQTSTENYVHTVVPQSAVSTETALTNLLDIQKQENILYYDGLGRPVQSVSVINSPAQKDLVQIMEYDAIGRQATQYLPYAASADDGGFRSDAVNEQSGFYVSTARVSHSFYPFAETSFEASPLNRPLEQSAPGEDWQLGNGHTVNTVYGINVANEVRIWEENSSGEIVTNGEYAAGELLVTTMENENGYKTITYQDKSGNIVLQKSQYGSGTTDYTFTSYVHDDLNKLIAVIPPKPYGQMLANVDQNNPEMNASTDAASQIYQYVYDERGRLVEKKIPHKGWEYLVYDPLDRLIFSQDALQRTSNEWSFTKYDELNRPVITGIYTQNTSRSALQTSVNAASVFSETRSATNYTTQFGYSNQALPTSSIEIYTVSYFDDYDFNYDGTADVTFVTPPTYTDITPAFLTAASGRTRGLPTGSKVKVLDGGSTFLSSSQWYNGRGEVIQTQANNHLSGTDVIHNLYDFKGRLVLSHHAHTVSSTTIDLRQRFTFDHAGRLEYTHHRIDSDDEIILSANKYNELGQLIDKKLHSTNLSSPKYLQSIDYSYNIRGWLTHINNDDLNDDEYNNSVAAAGLVVGYNMTKMDYEVEEITPTTASGDPGASYLALMISDESTLVVDGVVDTSLYQNNDTKVLKLVDKPEEGTSDPLYTSLSTLIGTTFTETYSPATEIDSNTTLEDLETWIYPEVSAALSAESYTNSGGVEAMQQQVFNYVTGKVGHIINSSQSDVFATADITIYFNEQTGSNLYMDVDDLHSSANKPIFIMALTTANQVEYDFLYDLTNPLVDGVRQASPIGISFDVTGLYEGMGIIEAIGICQAAAAADLANLSITNTDVIDHVKEFARQYALEHYGNQFFNDDENDLWGMEIKYNSPSLVNGTNPFGTSGLYNGNISEITWQSLGDEVKRGYGYQYDPLNRILSASYKAYNSIANDWTAESGRYDVSDLTYDLNGNILTLKRKGYVSGTIASPGWGLMDNLVYTYNSGDQLLSVADNSSVHHTNDFNDGNTSGNDYSYDVNGNLLEDGNKGISYNSSTGNGIYYNWLNLPTKVQKATGELVEYIYDALGTKLVKKFTNSGQVSSTHYTAVGNYTEDVTNASGTYDLDFVFTTEGRIVDDASSWRYEYYYTDHLGNTRLGFSDYNVDQEVDRSEITQQHNYYPFGLTHGGEKYGLAAQTTHKYLYNGIELQDEMEIDWYSMDLREYDPSIARWTATDPIIHHSMSVYNGFDNNPIIYADPSGGDSWLTNGGRSEFVNSSLQGWHEKVLAKQKKEEGEAESNEESSNDQNDKPYDEEDVALSMNFVTGEIGGSDKDLVGTINGLVKQLKLQAMRNAEHDFFVLAWKNGWATADGVYAPRDPYTKDYVYNTKTPTIDLANFGVSSTNEIYGSYGIKDFGQVNIYMNISGLKIFDEFNFYQISDMGGIPVDINGWGYALMRDGAKKAYIRFSSKSTAQAFHNKFFINRYDYYKADLIKRHQDEGKIPKSYKP